MDDVVVVIVVGPEAAARRESPFNQLIAHQFIAKCTKIKELHDVCVCVCAWRTFEHSKKGNFSIHKFSDDDNQNIIMTQFKIV